MKLLQSKPRQRESQGRQALESWWDDGVHDRAGDGHSCGPSEHAMYEALIVEASGRPDLVGESMSWVGVMAPDMPITQGFALLESGGLAHLFVGTARCATELPRSILRGLRKLRPEGERR